MFGVLVVVNVVSVEFFFSSSLSFVFSFFRLHTAFFFKFISFHFLIMLTISLFFPSFAMKNFFLILIHLFFPLQLDQGHYCVVIFIYSFFFLRCFSVSLLFTSFCPSSDNFVNMLDIQ